MYSPVPQTHDAKGDHEPDRMKFEILNAAAHVDRNRCFT